MSTDPVETIWRSMAYCGSREAGRDPRPGMLSHDGEVVVSTAVDRSIRWSKSS